MNENPKSNPVEDELDAIRIRIYEKTKDMSSEEQVAYFNNRAREVMAQLGLNGNFVAAPIIKGPEKSQAGSM